jgi:hypothetical protein
MMDNGITSRSRSGAASISTIVPINSIVDAATDFLYSGALLLGHGHKRSRVVPSNDNDTSSTLSTVDAEVQTLGSSAIKERLAEDNERLREENTRLQSTVEDIRRKFYLLEQAYLQLNQLIFDERSERNVLSLPAAMDVVVNAVLEQAQDASTLKAMTVSTKFNSADSVSYSDEKWLQHLDAASPLSMLFSRIFISDESVPADDERRYNWQSQSLACLLMHHHPSFHSERARRFQHNIMQISGSTLACNLCRYVL